VSRAPKINRTRSSAAGAAARAAASACRTLLVAGVAHARMLVLPGGCRRCVGVSPTPVPVPALRPSAGFCLTVKSSGPAPAPVRGGLATRRVSRSTARPPCRPRAAGPTRSPSAPVRRWSSIRCLRTSAVGAVVLRHHRAAQGWVEAARGPSGASGARSSGGSSHVNQAIQGDSCTRGSRAIRVPERRQHVEALHGFAVKQHAAGAEVLLEALAPSSFHLDGSTPDSHHGANPCRTS
jgi:hypothetical protein